MERDGRGEEKSLSGPSECSRFWDDEPLRNKVLVNDLKDRFCCYPKSATSGSMCTYAEFQLPPMFTQFLTAGVLGNSV